MTHYYYKYVSWFEIEFNLTKLKCLLKGDKFTLYIYEMPIVMLSMLKNTMKKILM